MTRAIAFFAFGYAMVKKRKLWLFCPVLLSVLFLCFFFCSSIRIRNLAIMQQDKYLGRPSRFEWTLAPCQSGWASTIKKWTYILHWPWPSQRRILYTDKERKKTDKKKNSEQRRNSRVSVQHSSTWRLVGVNVCVLCCMAYKCIHTRCSCVFVCRIMSDTKWCSKRKWKTDRQTVGRKKTTTTK